MEFGWIIFSPATRSRTAHIERHNMALEGITPEQKLAFYCCRSQPGDYRVNSRASASNPPRDFTALLNE
jgi:hypothetical protein